MPQRESIPKGYKATDIPEGQKNGFAFSAEHRGTTIDFTLEAIRSKLFRITFSSTTHPLPPYPAAQKPKVDVNILSSTSSSNTSILTTSDACVQVDHAGPPTLSVRLQGSEQPLYEDLPFRSYALDGPGVAHYNKYDKTAMHVGLGEKAAPMDLSGRQFRITATDSFGYDVYRTDPLYKHIPLLITARPEGVVATFSTSHARSTWSVGSEMDGLWGKYKVYRQDYGGLEEYLIIGKDLQEVVQTYAEVVGYPLLVPRWSFGYIAGGYKYAMMNKPIAADYLMGFVDKLREHDIPCSAMQLSSGYHVASEEPKVRNVFHWNRQRFPDPEKFLSEYRDAGLRVIANIKPFLLASHPDFDKLLKAEAFFTRPESRDAGYMRLWSAGGGESGEGCHLDFTSRAARDFWFNGIKQLAKEGVSVPWNDNNEYILPDDDWECKLDADEVDPVFAETVGKKVGLWGRAMHTELMGKASHDALVDYDPDRRPFILTRSATAGTMRYVCSSWSGDNVTSWQSMKGANAISLNAGMSLLQCFGHDIGGFEGPQPSPELLVRWVQIGAYSPRFAINCFKTSKEDNSVGEVIEPWMYPEVIPQIRAAIKRRYEILPYIYSLSLESHLRALPPQRWTGWGFETDVEIWSSDLLRSGETQYWLGDALLVGGVFEPDVSTAKMYLPYRSGITDAGFLNIHSPYQYLKAGQWVEISAPWTETIPVLARVGSAIPVGKAVQTKSTGETTDSKQMPLDDYRGVEIFPSPPSEDRSDKFNSYWLEDDGISAAPTITKCMIEYHSTKENVLVRFEREVGGYTPDWTTLEIILPNNDTRMVNGYGSCNVQGRRTIADGRLAFTIEF